MVNWNHIFTYNVKYNNLPANVLGGEMGLLNLLQEGPESFSKEQSQGKRLENYLNNLINGHNLTVQVTAKTPTSEDYKHHAQINICGEDETSAKVFITTALKALKSHTELEYKQI